MTRNFKTINSGAVFFKEILTGLFWLRQGVHLVVLTHPVLGFEARKAGTPLETLVPPHFGGY